MSHRTQLEDTCLFVRTEERIGKGAEELIGRGAEERIGKGGGAYCQRPLCTVENLNNHFECF